MKNLITRIATGITLISALFYLFFYAKPIVTSLSFIAILFYIIIFEFTKLFDYKNSSQNDRIQILFQLMTIADEKSIDAIGKCLKEDICRIVRHEAAFVLGEIANQKAVEYLIDICKTEKTPIVIHEILFALGTTGNKLAIKFIQNYINDKNYVISESAKIALDRINLLKKPYKGPEHFKYLN